MISELLERNGGRSLNQEELKQVALVVTQGETTKRLRRTVGQEAGLKYLTELIISENKAVEASRRPTNSQPESMATEPVPKVTEPKSKAAKSTDRAVEPEQESQKASNSLQRVQKPQKKPVQQPKRKAKKRKKEQDNGMEM